MIPREEIKPGDKFYVLYANSNQVRIVEKECSCVIETHNKDYDRKFIKSTSNTEYPARLCFKTEVDLMLFMTGRIKETWGTEVEIIVKPDMPVTANTGCPFSAVILDTSNPVVAEPLNEIIITLHEIKEEIKKGNR